ncbi:MAG: DoxX family protein [Cyclobacteriaceae bacterium]|nr:DoxX family protein [Cyclobacteriaceae bacterium]MCB0500250.1 DoxX family protein [Cyclobacteriaceae bacterium]MCB9237315.1 DoxX family protein [Flammeovirgaceae bacterium]MCO5271025.1 DoxX family protein [Cyclobacteriaceae bacterium]MCW5903402.1 DoxX family protein [Cyclobacteriaceae bacterium]
MRKYIDLFSRVFVGGLFIFSGLIKLNDPVGTQIKLEEYFEVFSADFGSFFHVFVPWALEIGMLLIVLELALGFAVLLYYKMNTTMWAMLALMVFFTFLTFYSAYFNKVTDCGCFGDAIKLTPWESFYKDVVLMVFVLHLFWYRKSYRAVLRTREGHAVMGVVVLTGFILGIYAVRHLPFIDFRPYKVGNVVPGQMVPEEQPVIEYLFEKDGGQVASQQFLPESEGYKYVSSRVLNEDKITPKITDYRVTGPDGEDKTQYTFEGNKLLIIMVDVGKASTQNLGKIRALINGLEGKVDCFILTSSGPEQVEAFRHEHQLAVPYYFADATVLKTILRSNPGVALWKNGRVLGNWHHNDTPTATEILSDLQ